MPITTISGELYLDGDVGDCGFPDYFTAKEVAQALAGMPKTKPAKVRLNSGGGIATEGPAIAAAFRAHKPGVEVSIEGIAASAATVAACAAARCTIGFGSLFMLHEASGFTMGPVDTHRQTIAELEVINSTMAGVYAAKTKRPMGEMRELMRAETWMGAEEAVARGFCDAVVGLPSDHPAFARHDYRQYRHAPPAVLARARRAGMAGAAPAKAEQDRAAGIADACNEAGMPELARGLILEPISLDEARRRVTATKARSEGLRLSRRSAARAAGLTTAQVDKMRADRGMAPIKW